MQDSSDPDGLRVFYYLVQDLKALVFTLISLHFKVGLRLSKLNSRAHACYRSSQFEYQRARHLWRGVHSCSSRQRISQGGLTGGNGPRQHVASVAPGLEALSHVVAVYRVSASGSEPKCGRMFESDMGPVQDDHRWCIPFYSAATKYTLHLHHAQNPCENRDQRRRFVARQAVVVQHLARPSRLRSASSPRETSVPFPALAASLQPCQPIMTECASPFIHHDPAVTSPLL